MNDLKVFLLATTGTLFMQAVEPLRLDGHPEKIWDSDNNYPQLPSLHALTGDSNLPPFLTRKS